MQNCCLLLWDICWSLGRIDLGTFHPSDVVDYLLVALVAPLRLMPNLYCSLVARMEKFHGLEIFKNSGLECEN